MPSIQKNNLLGQKIPENIPDTRAETVGKLGNYEASHDEPAGRPGHENAPEICAGDQSPRYWDLVCRVAVHEAGHAVMAFHVGRDVRHISMHLHDNPRPTLGEVLVRRPTSLLNPTRSPLLEGQTVRQTMIILAGPRAEGRYSGTAGPDAAKWQAHVDAESWQREIDLVRGLALRMCHPYELLAYLAWQESRVRSILDQPRIWCLVEVLSEHLEWCDEDDPILPASVARRICRDVEAGWERANLWGTRLPPISPAPCGPSPGNVT